MYGERIKEERNRIGVTQEYVGSKLGKTQRAIDSWEREERSPSVFDLANLCRLFECSSDWLLGLSDKRSA